MDNGLPTNEIYQIIEDRNHYLWMATNNGIVKYDGRKFTVFNSSHGLPHNEVYHLTEQFNGRIYGECRFAQVFYIEKDSIITFNKNNIVAKYIQGFPRIYSIILDKKENLYLGTLSGRLFFDKKGNVIYKDSHNLNTNRSGNNLVFIEDKILSFLTQFDSSKMNFLTRHSLEGVEHIYKLKEKQETAEAPYTTKINSGTWAIIDGAYVRVLNNDHAIHNILTPTRAVSVKAIDSILWIGTVNGGVFGYKLYADSISLKDHFLDGNTVTSTLKDHEGGYWFTTRENGVFHISNFNILKIYENNEKQNLNYFFKDDQCELVGYDNGQINSLTNKVVLNGSGPYSNINKYKSTYHFFSNGVKYEYSPNSKKLKSIYSSDKLLAAANFLNLNDSISVIQALNSFFLFNNTNYTITETTKEKIYLSRINCNHQIDGSRVAFGTSQGVVVYDVLNYKRIANYDLPSAVVSVNSYKGNIYAACSNGSFYLLGKEIQRIRFNDDLDINVIFDAKINKDILYVATNIGVHKYRIQNGNKLINISTTILKGLRKIYIYNGRAYYLTSNIIFEDLENDTVKSFPIVSIKNVWVNGKILSDNNRAFEHNENNIDFVISGISYTNKLLKFRYKLIGVNNVYQYTPDFKINYSSLNPGDYKFIISATNNGIDYSTDISYSFSIEKPVWKKNWFILLMLLIIIMAITYSVYLIVKQIKKKSKLNETISRLKSQALISQLNPHLVFNILNSIQGIVSKGDIEKANIFISRFAKFMRQTLWANQNPHISLESELEITENYISLEKLRFPSEMSIEIVRNTYQKERLVPSLLLQPFIENAIKHGIMPSLSKDGKISIIVSESELYLEIKIVDNGKGFENEIMYGDGLKITEERLKLLNELNTIQFERKDGLTVVTVKIYS